MGGKVLVPTQEAINKLVAARLAADVCDVPTVLVARTDAESANLLTSDVDERDLPFIASEGAHRPKASSTSSRASTQAIARGLAYAPYCGHDLVRDGHIRTCDEAKDFAEGMHKQVPGQAARVQLLAVVQLEEEARRRDDREVPARARGDGLQVPVHHARRLPRAQLLDVPAGARLQGIADDAPTSKLQQEEFAAEGVGYTATKHQREVGAGYFDDVTQTVAAGSSLAVGAQRVHGGGSVHQDLSFV